MADSILRLKVDSQEYDAKIKRAAEGIQQMAKRAHDMQGEFAGLDDSQKEFIKNLQYMTTVSASVTGQARELETAYKQLQSLYNSFTGFEKNSEEGKLLAQQLSILRQRTLDAKSAVSDANKSLENEGGILESLTSKFTFNIDALKVFDTAMSAVTSVLDIAKDAFFASEANVDEWGRTMASAEALYSGFVTALNSSDFSSFLTQIDGIVQAAREAYDELDKLGTMRTIQAPGFAKQETENQRLRLMIMTGKFIEAGDGRKSPLGLKNGDILSPEQIRTLERQLQNGMNKIVSLTKNELGQTGKAIDAYYNSLAKQNGMSIQEFRQGTSSWDAYQEKMRGYEQYQKWRRENSFTDAWGNRQVREGNPYQEFKKWGVFRVDKMGTNSYNDLVGLIKQQQQQQQQVYSTLGQTYRTINRAEGVTVRGILNGGGGGKGGGGGSGSRPSSRATAVKVEEVLPVGSIAEYTARIRELQTAQSLVTDTSSWKELQGEITHVTYLIKRLKGEVTVEKNVPAYSGPSLQDNISQQLKDLSKLNETATNGPKKEGDDTTEAWENAAKAIASAGSALQGLKEPSIKVAAIVGQAVANIALGFSKQSLAAAGGGPWAWIAAIAGGLGTMVSTIAAIKSATKGYSTGGRIEGNSYSGDNLLIPLNSGGYASLNAGEIVLNRAQTNNLANALTPQPVSNGGGAPYLTGELIFLGANNHLGRTGQGEIVTTSMLRGYGLIG